MVQPLESEGENKAEDGGGKIIHEELLLEARECDYAAFKESVAGQRKCVVDFLLAGEEIASEALAWTARFERLRNRRGKVGDIDNEAVTGTNPISVTMKDSANE